MEGIDERRSARRRRLLKGAELIYGASTVECIVRDISVTGARVKLNAPFDCPETLMLRLKSGEQYPAERRWTNGAEIGLRFTETVRLTGQSRAEHMASIYLDLLKGSPKVIVRQMHLLGFFGSEELRIAAEELEKAHDRLEAALARRIDLYKSHADGQDVQPAPPLTSTG